MKSPTRAQLEGYFDIFLAFATASTFVFMDIAAQYLQVIDPIDSISLMLLRMMVALVACYTYLYLNGTQDLPLGPEGYKTLILSRSISNYVTLLGLFWAFRHIR